MAYKYSKGITFQGDIKAVDDPERNTAIDFEDDYIGLVTSGSTTLVVSGSRVGIETTTPDYTLEVNGETKTFGGVYRKVRDVNSTSDILTTDYLLRCIHNSAITLTLPSKTNNHGQVVVIKDQTQAASTNNITIQGNGSDTIDHNATFVISVNKQCITLVCDGINGWMVTGVT